MKKICLCVLCVFFFAFLFSQERPVPPEGYILLPSIDVNSKEAKQTRYLAKVCTVTIGQKWFTCDMKLKRYQKGQWDEISKKMI